MCSEPNRWGTLDTFSSAIDLADVLDELLTRLLQLYTQSTSRTIERGPRCRTDYCARWFSKLIKVTLLCLQMYYYITFISSLIQFLREIIDPGSSYSDIIRCRPPTPPRLQRSLRRRRRPPREASPFRFYHSLQTPSPSPIDRLPLQERAHGPQVPFMSQKVRLLRAFTPELDGVAQCVHGLAVAADEGTAEVNVGNVVDLGLQVGDLANIVGDGVEEGAGDVGAGECGGGGFLPGGSGRILRKCRCWRWRLCRCGRVVGGG
jgi:hypothetical protein